MSNLNLSESAKEILNRSKETAGAEPFGANKKSSVTTPGQSIQDLGTAGHTTKDASFNATKGVPTATPPGAKPPVGSEPMKKLAKQPQEMGSANEPEGGETSAEAKVNRKKGPMPKATFAPNAGAKAPMVPEGEDEEEFEPEDEEQEWEDELEEASVEEVEADLKKLDDKSFSKKYGMSKQQVSAKLKDMQTEEASVEEVESDLEGLSEEEFQEKYSVSKKKAKNMIDPSCSMKEDIDAMLSGENLSEEFKERAAMIFEAAVNSRVEAIAEELQESFVAEFETAVDTIKEDFASKLDSYLDYVVENWMEENELAIEKGLRSEIVEDFIGALKNVFVEHYIDIPEEKVELVEELVSKVEELEDKVNEGIEKNIELKQRLNEHKKQEAIHDICEGLTLSQAEKVKSLAKSIDFVSEEDFSEKLDTIKESYFPSHVKSASADEYNEPVELDEDFTTKVVDPVIEQYASTLTRLTKF